MLVCIGSVTECNWMCNVYWKKTFFTLEPVSFVTYHHRIQLHFYAGSSGLVALVVYLHLVHITRS